MNNIFEDTNATQDSITDSIKKAIANSQGLLADATFTGMHTIQAEGGDSLFIGEHRLRGSVNAYYSFKITRLLCSLSQAQTYASRSLYPVSPPLQSVPVQTDGRYVPAERATSPSCTLTSAAEVIAATIDLLMAKYSLFLETNVSSVYAKPCLCILCYNYGATALYNVKASYMLAIH